MMQFGQLALAPARPVVPGVVLSGGQAIDAIMNRKWAKGFSLADAGRGNAPGATDHELAAAKWHREGQGTSKRFKIGRAVAVGVVAVATGGAALTAAGVIGSGAGVAAVTPATVAVPSAGLTAQAGVVAYAPQIAAAQAAASGATVAGGVTTAGVVAGIKSAASLVAVAGSLAGTVAGIKSAGMTAEGALPAYAEQMFDAGNVPPRALTPGVSVAGGSSSLVPILIGAALLFFVVLKK